MHTYRSHIQLVLAARIVETRISSAMPPKHKNVTEIGNMEQHDNGSCRAYAKGSEGLKRGPWRPCKEEALADLSKAREGAADATDVARGLASLQASTRSKFARVVKNLSSGNAVAVPSSASQHAEPPHPSHGDAEAEASPPAPPPGDAAEPPPLHSGDAVAVPSSSSQSAEPPHPSHGDAEAEAASPRSRPRAKKLQRISGFAAGRPRTEDDGSELILLIRQPWLDLILSGKKTWKTRSKSTNFRRQIWLAEPGTGLCSGQSVIDDVCEIEHADFAAYADKHQVRSPEGYAIVDKYASIYAWQLRDVMRFSVQRPFKQRPGAVIWVRHKPATAAEASEANAARGTTRQSVIASLLHAATGPPSSQSKAKTSGANTAGASGANTAGASEANGAAARASEARALREENAVLRAQLAEKASEASALREENAALRAQHADTARDNWVDGVRCGKRGLCGAATPVTPGRAGRVAPPQDAK